MRFLNGSARSSKSRWFAIYFSTTSKPWPTLPWNVPGAQRCLGHHSRSSGYFALRYLLDNPLIFCVIKLNDSFGGYLMNMCTWSGATDILIILQSSSEQIFFIIYSQSRAIAPTSTRPRNFGFITIWLLNKDTVCRSWRRLYLVLLLIQLSSIIAMLLLELVVFIV